MLKMKVPLCLSRGGLVEVGLGKDFGPESWSESGLKSEGAGDRGKLKENEGTLRKLIYVRTVILLFNSTYPSLLPS